MASQRFSRRAVAQRKSTREPKAYPVRLDFDDGSPSIAGMLSDLSATGARVSVTVLKDIPVRFTLHFPENTARRCRLVWQSSQSIGVEFLT